MAWIDLDHILEEMHIAAYHPWDVSCLEVLHSCIVDYFSSPIDTDLAIDFACSPRGDQSAISEMGDASQSDPRSGLQHMETGRERTGHVLVISVPLCTYASQALFLLSYSLYNNARYVAIECDALTSDAVQHPTALLM